MESAINFFVYIFILFACVFVICDIEKAEKVKLNIYEAVRSSNQNALLEIQSQIANKEVITSVDMVQRWVIDYCLISNCPVEIEFLTFGSNPPYYLVHIKGSDNYRFINQKLYSELISGTMIVDFTGEE